MIKSLVSGVRLYVWGAIADRLQKYSNYTYTTLTAGKYFSVALTTMAMLDYSRMLQNLQSSTV